MPIGGLRKVKRANYVQIDNETARDTRISYRALGVLTELISHEEGWIVRATDMAKIRKEGRDAIEAALRELRTAGYYRVERRRGTDGKWTTGGAVADYPIPQWADDHHKHPRGIPVAVLADGTVIDIDDTTATDPEPETPNPENPGSVTEPGFPGPGKPAAGNPVSLEHHPEHHPEEGDALRASTRSHVEPSRQQQAHVPREATDAAAAPEIEELPALAGRDAPRAATDPTAILDAAMLNAGERAAFRTWLRERAGAINPDGLVVELYRSGTLSARIIDWRSDSPVGARTDTQPTPVARTTWCGVCDRSTRLTITHDEHGGDLVRRCNDCHPAAGRTPHGSGTAAHLARDAELAAAGDTGEGRAAMRAARAKLPTGKGRRNPAHPTATKPTTQEGATS